MTDQIFEEACNLKRDIQSIEKKINDINSINIKSITIEESTESIAGKTIEFSNLLTYESKITERIVNAILVELKTIKGLKEHQFSKL